METARPKLWGLGCDDSSGRGRRGRGLGLDELLRAHDGEIQADLHLDRLAVDRDFGLAVDVPAQAAGAELLDKRGVRLAVDATA